MTENAVGVRELQSTRLRRSEWNIFLRWSENASRVFEQGQSVTLSQVVLMMEGCEVKEIKRHICARTLCAG